jgi:hypothetical protein
MYCIKLKVFIPTVLIFCRYLCEMELPKPKYKGSFTYDVITEGEGGFQMMTIDLLITDK